MPRPAARRRTLACLLVALGLPTSSAVAAQAPKSGPGDTDSEVTANWAGYVVHAYAQHFREVSAFWRQPQLTCTPPNRGYAQIGVGLGGYAGRSIAVEQVGTEADCSYTGKQLGAAWLRIAHRQTTKVSFQVTPGDVIEGDVQLGRGNVTLTLTDHTNGQMYSVMLADSVVDDSAAEWLVQAPSRCPGPTTTPHRCTPLPLSSFGAVPFGLAWTRNTNLHVGGLGDSQWITTRLSIGSGGHLYMTGRHTRHGAKARAAFVGGASPTSPTDGGSAFTVGYRRLAIGASPLG